MARQLLSLLLAAAALLGSLASAADGAPGLLGIEVGLEGPRLDLGAVVPGKEQEYLAAAQVLVSSPAAEWHLTGVLSRQMQRGLSLKARLRPAETPGSGQSAGDPPWWVLGTQPITLCSPQPPTGTGPQLFQIDYALAADWDVSPGKRDLRLHIGAGTGCDPLVSYFAPNPFCPAGDGPGRCVFFWPQEGPGVATFTVESAAGEPVYDQLVECTASGWQQVSWDGRKDGLPVPPGDYLYRVTSDGAVTLAAGVVQVTKETGDAGGSITGTVYAAQDRPIGRTASAADIGRPLAGAFLSLTSSLGVVEAVGTSDGAGRFAFKGLRPGRYTLTAQKPGYSSAAVQVEVDREVSRLLQLVLRRQPEIQLSCRPRRVADYEGGLFVLRVVVTNNGAGASGDLYLHVLQAVGLRVITPKELAEDGVLKLPDLSTSASTEVELVCAASGGQEITLEVGVVFAGSDVLPGDCRARAVYRHILPSWPADGALEVLAFHDLDGDGRLTDVDRLAGGSEMLLLGHGLVQTGENGIYRASLEPGIYWLSAGGKRYEVEVRPGRTSYLQLPVAAEPSATPVFTGRAGWQSHRGGLPELEGSLSAPLAGYGGVCRGHRTELVAYHEAMSIKGCPLRCSDVTGSVFGEVNGRFRLKDGVLDASVAGGLEAAGYRLQVDFQTSPKARDGPSLLPPKALGDGLQKTLAGFVLSSRGSGEAAGAVDEQVPQSSALSAVNSGGGNGFTWFAAARAESLTRELVREPEAAKAPVGSEDNGEGGGRADAYLLGAGAHLALRDFAVSGGVGLGAAGGRLAVPQVTTFRLGPFQALSYGELGGSRFIRGIDLGLVGALPLASGRYGVGLARGDGPGLDGAASATSPGSTTEVWPALVKTARLCLEDGEGNASGGDKDKWRLRSTFELPLGPGLMRLTGEMPFGREPGLAASYQRSGGWGGYELGLGVPAGEERLQLHGSLTSRGHRDDRRLSVRTSLPLAKQAGRPGGTLVEGRWCYESDAGRYSVTAAGWPGALGVAAGMQSAAEDELRAAAAVVQSGTQAGDGRREQSEFVHLGGVVSQTARLVSALPRPFTHARAGVSGWMTASLATGFSGGSPSIATGHRRLESLLREEGGVLPSEGARLLGTSGLREETLVRFALEGDLLYQGGGTQPLLFGLSGGAGRLQLVEGSSLMSFLGKLNLDLPLGACRLQHVQGLWLERWSGSRQWAVASVASGARWDIEVPLHLSKAAVEGPSLRLGTGVGHLPQARRAFVFTQGELLLPLGPAKVKVGYVASPTGAGEPVRHPALSFLPTSNGFQFGVWLPLELE